MGSAALTFAGTVRTGAPKYSDSNDVGASWPVGPAWLARKSESILSIEIGPNQSTTACTASDWPALPCAGSDSAATPADVPASAARLPPAESPQTAMRAGRYKLDPARIAVWG